MIRSAKPYKCERFIDLCVVLSGTDCNEGNINFKHKCNFWDLCINNVDLCINDYEYIYTLKNIKSIQHNVTGEQDKFAYWL